jgi:hypothetical protein
VETLAGEGVIEGRRVGKREREGNGAERVGKREVKGKGGREVMTGPDKGMSDLGRSASPSPKFSGVRGLWGKGSRSEANPCSGVRGLWGRGSEASIGEEGRG